MRSCADDNENAIVNKGTITRKMFPFDDVIMRTSYWTDTYIMYQAETHHEDITLETSANTNVSVH